MKKYHVFGIGNALVDMEFLVNDEWLWLLCSVRVSWTRVNLELRELGATKAGLRDHALDCLEGGDFQARILDHFHKLAAHDFQFIATTGTPYRIALRGQFLGHRVDADRGRDARRLVCQAPSAPPGRNAEISRKSRWLYGIPPKAFNRIAGGA